MGKLGDAQLVSGASYEVASEKEDHLKQFVGDRRKRAARTEVRPATLKEIMKICCEIGCEIRDLLPYCDPFGPWNS